MTDPFDNAIDVAHIKDLMFCADQLGPAAPEWLIRELADQLMATVCAFPPAAALVADLLGDANLDFKPGSS